MFKKSVYSLFIIFGLSISNLQANPFSDLSTSIETNERFDETVLNRFQSVLEHEQMSTSREFHSYNVHYHKTAENKFHIAIYNDVAVLTIVEGEGSGLQAIVNDKNEYIDVSDQIEDYGSYFTHDYGWGMIISYPHRQTIVFY